MPSTPDPQGAFTCCAPEHTDRVDRHSRRGAFRRLRGATCARWPGAAGLSPLAPFRVALRERDLRRLLAGLGVSEIGDWLYNVALLAVVFERTGSSAWLGITLAARMLPWAVFGPLGGVLADRVDRRALMIGSDLIRAACMAALVIVAVAGGPVVLIPALAAVCTAAGAPYTPCVLAVLPRLADDDKLPAANAARASLSQLAVVAGPVIGAGLLLVGPAAVAFAVNATTFLAGAAIVASLPREALRRPPAGDRSHATLRSDLRDGWSALRRHPDARAMIGADVLSSAVYGGLTVLFVLIGRGLGLDDAGYAVLLAAFGAGGVISGGLANRAAASADPRRAFTLAMVAVGAPIPLFALLHWVVPAVLLAATLGAGALVANVVMDTHLQRSLDPAVFARAFGLALPAALAGVAVGALLTPPCLSLLGLNGTLALLGAATLAYTALVVARPSATPAPAH